MQRLDQIWTLQWYIVGQTQTSHAQETTIFYQAIGELAQRYADAWVGGAGLFWAPGIVVGLSQDVVIVIGIGVVEFIGIHHFIAYRTMELSIQCKSLVADRGVETEGEVGVRVAQNHAVFGVDNAIFIGIDIGNVSSFERISVIHQSVGCLVALQDTIGFVSPE